MASSVRMDVKEVLRHFQQLEDPRSSVNLLHPLDSVVVIAIMAVLAGANGPTAIARPPASWILAVALLALSAFANRHSS